MIEYTFDIPYIFKVTGVPKRGINERSAFVFERLPFTVREIPRDDAPIAATFPTPLIKGSYLGEDGQVTLRHYAGRLYVKALTEYYDKVNDVTPEMLAKFLEHGVHAVEHSDRLRKVLIGSPDTIQRALFPEKEAGTNPIKPFREDQWQNWRSDDQNDSRSKLEELYSGLIIIDGQFWLSTPEPVYVLRKCYSGDESYFHLEISRLEHARAYQNPDRLYGFNGWDHLISEAIRFYDEAPDDDRRATVFIEEAFSYDEITERFVRGITTATEQDGNRLKSFEVKAMIAWAELRDCLEMARSKNFTTDAIDALAEVSERYARSGASQGAKGEIAKALEELDYRKTHLSDIIGAAPRI